MSINFNNDGKKVADIFSPKGKIIKEVFVDEENEGLDKIRINDETYFFPTIPDYETEEQVDRIYVCGESGVGKSSFVREYVIKFLGQYPKATCLLFSSKNEDKQLDDIPAIIRVKIDDDIHINPYTLAEISSNTKPTLCIFDDCEDFPNKKINKEIERLRDEVMRNGRSNGIYSIFIHHNPTDYKATRNMIFEANKVVIFPRRSGRGTYNYLLDKKLLISKEHIDMINTLKSTYVIICKQIPKCIISNKYIILC
jgi:hypothetical protein